MTDLSKNYTAHSTTAESPSGASSNGQHPNGTKPMLDAALEMARHGWRVFPVRKPKPDGTCSCSKSDCKDAGKHPHITGWPIKATTDEAQIRAWWKEWSNANVGIATGRESNLLVLDADGELGRQSLADGRPVPDGPKVSTGRKDGGVHHYFTCPDDFDARNFAGEIPGLDARANGGYVIAAESTHQTGNKYRVVSASLDQPLPAPPSWLVDVLKQARAKPSAAADAMIPAGSRDSTLTSIAGGMRRLRHTEASILASLRVINETQCEEPLDDEALQKIAKSIGNRDMAHPLIALSLDDIGNAERFAAYSRGQALWIEETKQWLAWDGKRWAKSSVAVDRLATATARSYLHAVADMDDQARGKVEHLAHAFKLQKNDALKNMLRWAPQHLVTRLDRLDQRPWLLNCLNGTLNLRTGELQSHNPADLLTQIIDIKYDPEAECPTWDAYLARALKNRPEVLEFLDRLIGYFLTGQVTVKMLPIIWGLADTGKSVLTSTLLKLLGEYAQVMSEATLAYQQKPSAGGSASPDLARLVGCRLAVASETSEDLRLNEARVKGWTGRTKLTARALHKDPFDFMPTHKLIIETNNRPMIPNGDQATWRRVVLIPFLEVIPKAEQDEGLEDQLTEELPGILARAVRGCLDWVENGLPIPEELLASTQEYQLSQDSLADFFAARCVVKAGEYVAKTELYLAYIDWSKTHEKYALGRNKFNARMESSQFREARHPETENSARVWDGISLKAPEDIEEDGEEAAPSFNVGSGVFAAMDSR